VTIDTPEVRQALAQAEELDEATVESVKPSTGKNFSVYKYYADKLREVKELDRSVCTPPFCADPIMATTCRKEIVMISMRDFTLIHPIDCGVALKTAETS